MQYSERLPVPLPTRSLVTPLVALLIGAAAATGAYALIDDGDELQPSQVIVVERPLPVGEGVAAKDEAASAAAIGAVGTELRGSKASASGVAFSGPR
jgi:hypothetical protein